MRQLEPILQTDFLDPPWSFPAGDRLPGVAPVGAEDWLRIDEAFGAQMALRDRLIEHEEKRVLALLPEGRAFAEEALKAALNLLPKLGFTVLEDVVIRPDGVAVRIEHETPMHLLGRLVQEDICLLLPSDAGHRLVGAALCFPASWSLTEKLGRPMAGIHDPVAEYDDALSARVERMFTGLRSGVVIRRANCLAYSDFTLFQPRFEADRREIPDTAPAFIRTERQCLLKLPTTGGIVFSIHTNVVAREALPAETLRRVDDYLKGA